MKRRSYFYCGWTTTLNVILYTLSFGKYLWLEGRVVNGSFSNWLRRFRFRPAVFAQPATEQEIIDLIKNSSGIRAFGSGHSFNIGPVADHTLISLDNYSGLISIDRKKNHVAVKGGTRVREVSRLLFENGLAISALPSHDAQSIAGIISTDVHGTGRDWGFVSQHVVSIKLIDGNGEVHVLEPGDELFKAAIGGIGGVGIITEVTLHVVDRFNLRQKIEMSHWSYVKQNLDDLLAKDVHMSLYLFPFTDRCQINTWNPTTDKRLFASPFREYLAISIDALLAAWFGNLMSYAGLLPKLSDFMHGLKRGTNLVMESYKGFNRTVYHLHQELEFAVPYERTAEVCERFRKLYEEMYVQQKLPYTLFEVRFTPGGHDRTMIGPGRERKTMWLDLLANDSHGFEEYFAAAEQLMREVDARPHPGKFNETFGKEDLLKMHGENFVRFLELREQHDPERKFGNEFTRRLYG
jgi:FAD/FMN-containing dehydrogenase